MIPNPPIVAHQLRTVPPPCSWGDQGLVRERSIARLSPAACALSLFLGTVAAAQGLSDDADPSLCQRLTMPSAALPQARQALITRGLGASHPPLSQV